MKCQKCGATLPDGCVVCPRCGTEVQIVTAVDDLEEEMLREQLLGENAPSDARPTTADTRSPSAEKAAKARQRQRQRQRRILITLLVIAAAAVVVVLAVLIRQNRSPDHLLRNAQQEYGQHAYDDALRNLDRLLDLDAENVEGWTLAGASYEALMDYDEAEQSFLRAIQLDPDNADAYAGLLAVYDAQGKTDEIQALQSGVTNEDILVLFDDYVVPVPEIRTSGGEYDAPISVEIRAPKKGLTVCYTLDGTEPTRENAMLYTGPIKIEEGLTVVTAVCLNEDGEMSESVSEQYEIRSSTP